MEHSCPQSANRDSAGGFQEIAPSSLPQFLNIYNKWVVDELGASSAGARNEQKAERQEKEGFRSQDKKWGSGIELPDTVKNISRSGTSFHKKYLISEYSPSADDAIDRGTANFMYIGRCLLVVSCEQFVTMGGDAVAEKH